MQQQFFWTDAEIATLTQLFDGGCSAVDIAGKMPDRTHGAILQKLAWLKAKRALENVAARGIRWEHEDVKTLLRMVEVENKTWPECDKFFGRDKGSSYEKYRALCRAHPISGVHKESDFIKPDERALSERAARAALSHTSLTAAFFGDPLPGQSALDRRREASA